MRCPPDEEYAIDKLTDTRRNVIKSAAIGVGFGSLSAPVLGRPDENGDGEGGRVPLIDGPAEFRVFVGKTSDDGTEEQTDEPDKDGEFAYPTGPTLASEDPAGGLFDASEIEKTPEGSTLHHTLQFFQGFLMRTGRAKPYVLVHEGNGRFRARGQHVNFEARTTSELKALFSRFGMDPALADAEPLVTLAGGTWRGVGNEVVQFLGDPEESRRIRWSATRVDFYDRDRGRPSYELSVLYVIYPNLDGDGNPTEANPADPTLGAIPPGARQAGRELITDGRANLGGR